MDPALWWFAAVAAAQETVPPPPAPTESPTEASPTGASPTDETESDEGPALAIPIDAPEAAPAAERAPVAVRGNRSSEPPRNPAFRAYRDRALALRTFSETHVGTTWDYVAVGRWGPYGYHTGWRPWPRPYLVRTTASAVFQGPKALDVPTTLGILGDEAAKTDLDRRIRTNQNLGNVGYGLGVVGVAASVVGLIALDQCCSGPIYADDTDTLRSAYTWSTVSVTGVALMVGGFIGGTFPSARAERLRYDYTATLTRDELEGRIAQHNDALAAELGLDPKDANRLDARPARRRR